MGIRIGLGISLVKGGGIKPIFCLTITEGGTTYLLTIDGNILTI